MNRKLVMKGINGVAGSLAVIAISYWFTSQIKSQPLATRSSYTIKQRVNYWTDGVAVVSSVETKYVRSDGSFGHETVIQNYDVGITPHREIVDLRGRLILDIDPNTKTWIRTVLPEHTAGKFSSLFSSSRQRFGANTIVSRSSELIAGYQVESASIPAPGAAAGTQPSFSMQYLVAPALNYEILKSRIFKDGQLAESRETISVVPGDPDSALFDAPSEYIEASSHKDYLTNVEGARGRPLKPESGTRLEQMDAKPGRTSRFP